MRIGEHEYLIKSDGNAAEVLKIADYVNTKIKEAEGSAEGLSERKTAVLAAMQIAGEFFQILKERDEMVAKMRRQTQSIIEHIDSVMEREKNSPQKAPPSRPVPRETVGE